MPPEVNSTNQLDTWSFPDSIHMGIIETGYDVPAYNHVDIPSQTREGFKNMFYLSFRYIIIQTYQKGFNNHGFRVFYCADSTQRFTSSFSRE